MSKHVVQRVNASMLHAGHVNELLKSLTMAGGKVEKLLLLLLLLLLPLPLPPLNPLPPFNL